jgi:hypothetical protein
MCIIDGAVRVTDGEIGNVMTIVGQLLLCLPWVSVLLTPFYLAARHYRHLPSSKVPYSSYQEFLVYKQPKRTDGQHKQMNFRRNKPSHKQVKKNKRKKRDNLYKNLPPTHTQTAS